MNRARGLLLQRIAEMRNTQRASLIAHGDQLVELLAGAVSPRSDAERGKRAEELPRAAAQARGA